MCHFFHNQTVSPDILRQSQRVFFSLSPFAIVRSPLFFSFSLVILFVFSVFQTISLTIHVLLFLLLYGIYICCFEFDYILSLCADYDFNHVRIHSNIDTIKSLTSIIGTYSLFFFFIEYIQKTLLIADCRNVTLQQTCCQPITLELAPLIFHIIS